MDLTEQLLALRPELVSLVAAFHGANASGGDEWVEFEAGDLWVLASIQEHKRQVRVRVFLQADEEELVNRWIAKQPALRSGILDVGVIEDGDWRPRLVFERVLGAIAWDSDPMFADVEEFASAWLEDRLVSRIAAAGSVFQIQDDPRDKTPQSAWLLIGSEASFPDQAELDAQQEAARVGIFEWDWTTASQTQIGDLALFYFISPRKSVNFVARAASDAYFSRDVDVDADRSVSSVQWWADFTTPIEIEPIPVATLRDAAGGYLPLRGRSGHFLNPSLVEQLNFVAKNPNQQTELERLFVTPIGRADLPNPQTMTVAAWREIAAGALRLESDVSTYLVEPLLRTVLRDTSLTIKREYPVGRGWADFVILNGETVIHVIEVKKVIRGLQNGAETSGDLKQLLRYMHRLDVPGTLFDSHRLFLVARGSAVPHRHVERISSDDDDIRSLRAHIVGRDAT